MKPFKRLATTLASVFGLSASAADPKVQMVDPRSLLFSVSTIENELPPSAPAEPLGDRALVIVEDDWRQFEFVSDVFQKQVDEELRAIAAIFTEQRVDLKGGMTAFRQLHLRKLIPRPLESGISWRELQAALGPAAKTHTSVSFRESRAPIVGGFGTEAGAISIFGTTSGDTISTLCLTMDARPGLDAAHAKAVEEFATKHRLLLVHWPSRTLIATDRVAQYFQQK